MKDMFELLKEIEQYVQKGEGEPRAKRLIEQAAGMLRSQHKKIQELRKINSLMDSALNRQEAISAALNGDI